MLNLLTESDKQFVRRLYAGRVLIAVFSVSFIASLFGVISLLPPYFLIQSQARAAREQMALVEQSIAAKSDEATNPVLADARRKLTGLSAAVERAPIHSFFETILSLRIAPVHITGLSYETNAAGGAIHVLGVADAREPLTRFVKILAREGSFSAVDLPVSNLAENADISFSVSARGAF